MKSQSFSSKYTYLKLVMLFLFPLGILSISCQKFLDIKTDRKLVVPESIQDAQALLDSYSLFNEYHSAIGGESDDDFYILYNTWQTAKIEIRNNYIWEKENYNKADWQYLYQMILFTNVAIETLQNVPITAYNKSDWQQTMGSALFLRANAFYQIAQFYAIPYDKNTASENHGIPLRLSSDATIKTTRSTLKETYDQIILDYKKAILLLPIEPEVISRPSKAAAYAALARVCLMMEDYKSAGNFADSCLKLHNALIDYNTLDTLTSTPFTRFNKEVIFPSRILGSAILTFNNWKVDSSLYSTYHEDDLRRRVFYKSNGTGTFGFTGNYNGTTTGSSLFNGIAVDEVYLISAECKARLNDKEGALNLLNTLLISRWKTGKYVPFTALNAEDALQIILLERRKELVARCLRWFDLRRLNKNPSTAKTLVRILDGNIYTLPPNDPRYTHYIPLETINMTGIDQNER